MTIQETEEIQRKLGKLVSYMARVQEHPIKHKRLLKMGINLANVWINDLQTDKEWLKRPDVNG